MEKPNNLAQVIGTIVAVLLLPISVIAWGYFSRPDSVPENLGQLNTSTNANIIENTNNESANNTGELNTLNLNNIRLETDVATSNTDDVLAPANLDDTTENTNDGEKNVGGAAGKILPNTSKNPK